jgi:hypothetical protein
MLVLALLQGMMQAVTGQHTAQHSGVEGGQTRL